MLFWVLAFCAACVAGSFMLARPEKPEPTVNGVTSGPVRLIMDTNLGYMTNGLIVVTNMSTNRHESTDAFNPRTLAYQYMELGFMYGWEAHRRDSNGYALLDLLLSNRHDLAAKWLNEHPPRP